MATVALWHTWRDKPMRRKVGLSLSAFFLLLAFFKAWQDEHAKAQDQNTYMEVDPSPDFSQRAHGVRSGCGIQHNSALG